MKYTIELTEDQAVLLADVLDAIARVESPGLARFDREIAGDIEVLLSEATERADLLDEIDLAKHRVLSLQEQGRYAEMIGTQRALDSLEFKLQQLG